MPQKIHFNETVPLYQQKTWNTMWSLKKSRTPMSDAISQSLLVPTTSRTQSWSSATRRIWSLSTKRCRTFTVRRRRTQSKGQWRTLCLCCCCYFRRTGLQESLGPFGRDHQAATWPGVLVASHQVKWPVLSSAAKTMSLSASTSESSGRPVRWHGLSACLW